MSTFAYTSMNIFWQDCVGENLLHKPIRKKKTNADEAGTQPIEQDCVQVGPEIASPKFLAF